eukprot:3448142-Amphidinium_carterae.1
MQWKECSKEDMTNDNWRMFFKTLFNSQGDTPVDGLGSTTEVVPVVRNPQYDAGPPPWEVKGKYVKFYIGSKLAGGVVGWADRLVLEVHVEPFASPRGLPWEKFEVKLGAEMTTKVKVSITHCSERKDLVKTMTLASAKEEVFSLHSCSPDGQRCRATLRLQPRSDLTPDENVLRYECR